MNINVRYCKECKKPYDIGTNFKKCPECRNKVIIKKINKKEIN